MNYINTTTSYVLLQKTLKRKINFSGVGIHSGRAVSMSIEPAEAGTGIIFERTDLEKAILANDKDLAQVNSELAEVQSRLAIVQRELEKALENYDFTLNDLAAVQENIVNEQIKLGKIKNEIIEVSDELFETQKQLLGADEKLQEQAVSLYINGVMSPTTALFIELDELKKCLIFLDGVKDKSII